LIIQPENRLGEITSSCKILSKAFGDSVDAHTKALLHAGDEADKMNYNTKIGTIFNNSTKVNPMDDEFRIYVTRHMAKNTDPDAKIQERMDKYDETQKNN